MLMDEEFDRLEKMSEEENKDFEETEMKIAENEAIILQSMHKKFTMGVSLWTGECCQTFKTAMHSGNYDKPFVAVKDCLTERPLSRDVVVRRGNCSFNALGLALDADDYTPEEIKKKLQERMDSGQELILNESAMMSTAFPFAKAKYDAGQTSIGIEYIILVKKGTTAVNAIPIAYKNEEGELLIAQNTKFRVIKAQLDGDANIICGHKQSWKIYLVTVPESTNGVKN